jgi:organic radical activating enzyme
MNLEVSEMFASLQGEGHSMGSRALFIRLSKCNLCCGCGDLREKGEATWTCDSQLQMKTFTEYTPADLIVEIEKKFGEEYLNKIFIGDVRVVITGGEPALYAEPLISFLDMIDKMAAAYQTSVLKWPKNALRPPLYEVETNGTIFSGAQQFYERFSFVNCSPKLASSGMAKDKRVVPFALIEIAKYPYSSFKFVISKDTDWNEIRETFIDTGYIQIHQSRIFLMPAGNTLEELAETSKAVWRMAEATGCLATTRLQSITWGPKPGI